MGIYQQSVFGLNNLDSLQWQKENWKEKSEKCCEYNADVSLPPAFFSNLKIQWTRAKSVQRWIMTSVNRGIDNDIVKLGSLHSYMPLSLGASLRVFAFWLSENAY